MHALLRFRSISFALFLLFNVLNIAFAAWSVTVMGSASPAIRGVVIYTLLFNSISLILVGGMFIMERIHASNPKLWIEVAWVGIFALFSLGSAAAATSLIPSPACGTKDAQSNPNFCVSGNAVAVTTWLTTLAYLGWLVTMIIHGVSRSSYDPGVWRKGIKDADVMPENNSDANLTEKFAGLPTLTQNRPDTRTSEYSISTEKDKDDISIVMPYNFRNGPIGVNAINGAPAYHPYSTANAWNQRNLEQGRVSLPPAATPGDNIGSTGSPQTIEVPPRRPFMFAARHYAMSSGGSEADASANPRSNPSSDFDWINTAYKHAGNAEASPSPAVIMQVHKVPAQSTLQGAQVATVEDLKRARSNTDPTRGGIWFPSSQSLGQPDRSSLILVDERRPSEGGIGLAPQAPFRMGHAPSLSTDSAFRAAGKKPKHRPPPLDLSRLSNVKQAERR